MNFRINFKRIRHAFFSAFGIITLLVIAMGVVLYAFLYRINTYHHFKGQVKELSQINGEVTNLEGIILIKDAKNIHFLKTGESPSVNQYERKNRKIRTLLKNLEQNSLSQNIKIQKDLEVLKKQYTSYNRVFSELKGKIQYRGFKDVGLEGKMRKAAHQLEAMDSLYQPILLNLRRYEKDFFNRRQLVYVDKVKHISSELIQYHKDSLSEEKANLIEAATLAYLRNFNEIVKLEKSIGLKDSQGLKAKLAKANQELKASLSKVDYLITQRINNRAERTTAGILYFLIFLIIVSTIIGIYISWDISSPIISLNRITKSVTKGLKNQDTLLEKKVFNRRDEIGSLAKNFKYMLVRLKNTIQQADEKTQKLEDFAEKEKLRTWHAEGLGIFGEIFKKHHDNLEAQAFEIISELVKYTKSNQGGLFVIVENEEGYYLELKGCYAYERKKYQQKRIDYGEGLVGAVWREEETKLIEDIPEDYIFISSGLGKAKPKCLLIVPIKSEDEIVGVIELVSFTNYEKHEIEFIEGVAERVGSALIASTANEKTKEYLAISERVAEKSQEKEAELQKQVDFYQKWVKEFEQDLNNVSEESQIYQSIVGKVFGGMILTDESFNVTKVNAYVTKKFGYKREDLVGKPLANLIELERSNIIDLKDRKFKINLSSFQNKVSGKLIDKKGKIYPIESISGKLQLDIKTFYVFLINDLENTQSGETKERKLKVAS